MGEPRIADDFAAIAAGLARLERERCGDAAPAESRANKIIVFRDPTAFIQVADLWPADGDYPEPPRP